MSPKTLKFTVQKAAVGLLAIGVLAAVIVSSPAPLVFHSSHHPSYTDTQASQNVRASVIVTSSTAHSFAPSNVNVYISHADTPAQKYAERPVDCVKFSYQISHFPVAISKAYLPVTRPKILAKSRALLLRSRRRLVATMLPCHAATMSTQNSSGAPLHVQRSCHVGIVSTHLKNHWGYLP